MNYYKLLETENFWVWGLHHFRFYQARTTTTAIKSPLQKIFLKKYPPRLALFIEVKLFHCFLKWRSRCVPEHIRYLSALELRVIVYGTQGLSLKRTEWTHAQRHASWISSEHATPRVNKFVNLIWGKSYCGTVRHTEAASPCLGLPLPRVHSRLYMIEIIRATRSIIPVTELTFLSLHMYMYLNGTTLWEILFT